MLVLDAMRGVAALAVLVHHAGGMATGHLLLPRGYLAVDFFFMLSGFVMTRTFEPRFHADLGVSSFMAARLRRLYPTIAAGILLGACADTMDGEPVSTTAGLLAAELLFLPSLHGGELGIFRLDGVQWSLLLELVANAVHAAILWRVRQPAMVLLAILLSAGLATAVLNHGTLALGDRGITAGAGLLRVSCPYVIGILLGRCASPAGYRAAAPFGILPVVLLAAILGAAGLVPARWDGWWTDIVVLIGFPGLLLWGSRATLSAGEGRLATLAGNLSYPLYAVHLPAMRLALPYLSPVLWPGAPLLAGLAGAAIMTARVVKHALAHRGSVAPVPSRPTTAAAGT